MAEPTDREIEIAFLAAELALANANGPHADKIDWKETALSLARFVADYFGGYYVDDDDAPGFPEPSRN